MLLTLSRSYPCPSSSPFLFIIISNNFWNQVFSSGSRDFFFFPFIPSTKPEIYCILLPWIILKHKTQPLPTIIAINLLTSQRGKGIWNLNHFKFLYQDYSMRIVFWLLCANIFFRNSYISSNSHRGNFKKFIFILKHLRVWLLNPWGYSFCILFNPIFKSKNEFKTLISFRKPRKLYY